MSKSVTLTLTLVAALLLASCSKPEPQTMVIFSCENGKFSSAFQMTGKTIHTPLDDEKSPVQEFRFVVEEGEWVDFIVEEDKKQFSYQAHFSKAPNYQFEFVGGDGHHFWQGPDPEVQSVIKFLNAPDQAGTIHWR